MAGRRASDRICADNGEKSNINTKALLPAILRFCLLFSESDSAHQKRPILGLKKLWNGPPEFILALSHILNAFFAKNWTQIGLL